MGLTEGATERNGGQVGRQVRRRKAERPVRGSPYTSPGLMSDGSLIVIVDGRYSGSMKNAWFFRTTRNGTTTDVLPVANTMPFHR